MPQLQNAKKALRQNISRQAHNRGYKNRIKKLYRQISNLVNEGKKKEATELLPAYYKIIDKAAKKNILSKNTASRKKSVANRKISLQQNTKIAKSKPTKNKKIEKAEIVTESE